MSSYDIVVIGGGTGGLSVARAAARRGARALIIHDGPLGGDCTFTGCVPSKTLIEAGHRGLRFDEAMRTVSHAVDHIAATETPEVLRGEGVDTRPGRAAFLSRRRVDVDGTAIDADRIVIATGAGPSVPPIEGLDTVDYLTNETVFDLRTQPASLIVLGGGAIGCELAQAFAAFGTRVTVIEGLDRLLPREEPEASATIADTFATSGIDVRVAARVTKVEAAGPGVRVHLDSGDQVESDRILVAVGRRPNTDGLDPERAGVELDDRGFVRTDDHLATTARRIWAVGDVTGRLQFTHAADAMGRVAAANALGRYHLHRFRADPIPWVTYTTPEVARVGIAEADAPANARVAMLPMTAVDRAITADDTRGFVKLIAGPNPIIGNAGGGRLLGATIVAARAGELIHEPALAMQTRMFTGRLAQLPHAYPTWSVAIQQAAAQFFMELDGRSARPARPE
jgi:pyruvate/2-oxoglutarate dehydrogenase complex dihydrolipoamide dehydrogenase (E3) component